VGEKATHKTTHTFPRLFLVSWAFTKPVFVRFLFPDITLALLPVALFFAALAALLSLRALDSLAALAFFAAVRRAFLALFALDATLLLAARTFFAAALFTLLAAAFAREAACAKQPKDRRRFGIDRAQRTTTNGEQPTLLSGATVRETSMLRLNSTVDREHRCYRGAQTTDASVECEPPTLPWRGTDAIVERESPTIRVRTNDQAVPGTSSFGGYSIVVSVIRTRPRRLLASTTATM